MARRNQRRGDYLVTSDYSGCTTYASKVVQDYWGNWGESREILQRNLQEIAFPLADPYPVYPYLGPDYEAGVTQCTFELQPTYIGKTTIPFPNTQYTQLFNLNPGIGQMSVGCTFVVR